ncbi:glycosyltransferase family 39 protein [Iningainema tapete]|uniref:Glycosyltransferase RgtA/B/C/D-like domain-containing protein n=1 Tax=Iningainema tapete BLCC-T55 TaxID=2748662 RepID=A0A8J6XTY4_9CYAN|nr:hypothetical protein [Iningainema tapete]MBD2778414.1 hypothetical protein [Iningainema tapete BLCC-T55]
MKISNIYRKNQIYLNVFIFFCSLFALTNSGFDNSEGLFHYQVAVQLIKHGKLGFDTLPEGIFQLAPNGRAYAGHEIGNTLFLLPTAFINVLIENFFSKFVSTETIEKLQQFILSFQAGVYSSVTATTLFAILRTGFSISTIPSFIVTLCLTLTTYFWIYARNLFDGVLCSTLLTLSFFFLIRYRQKNNLWLLFSCFICLGFGLITRLSMILAILVSFVYLITIRRSLAVKFREITLTLITLLPFLIWQCWYNYLRTGIFYKSPVQTAVYADNNALDGNIVVGITGLLLSPGKSLLIYAPLLILSVFLFKKFYREHHKEAIYTAALFILWLLLHARLRSWYGGWGWGPRHFITILPIIFLPFAVNIEYILKKITLKISAILLSSFGFLLTLSAIISNWHFRMMYANQQGRLTDSIFIWGIWNSQSVDMLKAAFSNIVRILTNTPVTTTLNTYSQANVYASSTLNIWVNSLIYAGIPWYAAITLAFPPVILMYWSLRNILRCEINLLPKAKHC